ncbi:Inner membrane protein YkgB [Pseudoalteromonas sp. P1-9]|uniref:DUF417 family protein n=1 Tax=Pseudoalteromonas sp. P1-9 TaxID=1710354 RepID=UPI0006D63173|nr:DUF417 family protein [Pseudoalteromonas sp. P1-9]KPV95867.1 Inner membrane protein YkgB [Pseudoalteromonas sp. P1-9]
MKESSNKVIVGALLGISGLLMAISTLLIGQDVSLQRVLDFYLLDSVMSSQYASLLAGFTFLGMAIIAMLSIKKRKYQGVLSAFLLVISIVPLLTLLDSSRWIADLGGFPAIGSGQGIIKYFALLALAIHFLYAEKMTIRQQQWVQLFPVVLVLLWIGGMKFTEIEAQGIEDLVRSSPLMSWMYHLWSVQTASNLIGIYDLIALGLLVLSVYFQRVLWLGILMAGAVMLTTQTFLFTWPPALSSDTVLSSGGQFLIKDLWFVANLVLFTCLAIKQSKQAQLRD